jgi:DNA-binding CsgD family transcriptional regulator
VQRYAAVLQRLNAMERGLERGGAGVVVLEEAEDGPACAFVSAEATRLLGIDGPESGQPLPAKVKSWLADLNRGAGASGSTAPLLIEDAGIRVVIHFVPARERGEPDALLVERAEELLTIPQLRAAGLTARQAEILRQVALGQTNAEIAAELELSPRTVQKHLENIYEQLGTRSRTEALLTAWSIAQLGP